MRQHFLWHESLGNIQGNSNCLPQQENTILISLLSVWKVRKSRSAILKTDQSHFKRDGRKFERGGVPEFSTRSFYRFCFHLHRIRTQKRQVLKTFCKSLKTLDPSAILTTPYTAPIRTACRIWKSVGNLSMSGYDG